METPVKEPNQTAADAPAAVNGSSRVIGESGFGKKRLTINTVASSVYYVLMVLVGVLYTPYMLQRVPEAVYGLVPLATSLTSHLGIVMVIIGGPVCRYVTVELSKGDLAAANATFNSFFFGGAKIIGLLMIVVVAFCAYLPINVPAGYELKARFLFAAIGFSSMLFTLSSTFDTGYWATNRFEIRSIVDSVAMVLRNLTVVALFTFTKPDIWQISVAVILAAFVHILLNYQAWKRLVPQLRLDPAAQTPERKKLIYSVGQWLMVSTLGNQLLMSCDLFLINRFFGTTDNTKYGILLLLATIVRSVFVSLGQLLIPSLVVMEVTADRQRMIDVTTRTMRLSGAMVAHAGGTMTGFAAPLLYLWIKKPWVVEIAPLAGIILLPLCFEILCQPLTSMLIAQERVSRFAKISVACGLTAVIAALVLLATTELHFYAVALAIASVTIVRHGILNPMLAASGTGAPWYTFARTGIPMTARFALSTAVSYAIAQWMPPSSIPMLGLCALASLLIALPPSVSCLPYEDRAIIFRLTRLPQFG